MVVLVSPDEASGAAVCYDRCVSLHAASSLHEFFGAYLVHPRHDSGSGDFNRSVDLVYLCGKLLQGQATAPFHWRAILRIRTPNLGFPAYRNRIASAISLAIEEPVTLCLLGATPFPVKQVNQLPAMVFCMITGTKVAAWLRLG